MKKLLLGILTAVLLQACATDKLDDKQAQVVAEDLITKISKEDYQGASKLFTTAFNESEAPEAREAKYKQLKDALGDLTELSVSEIKNEQPTGEESRVTVIFNVKHTKLTTKETIVITKDEGEYRVAAYNIEMTK